MSIKKEISDLLTPFFGSEIKKMIEEHYEEKEAQDLVNLATSMLTNYLGEKRANEIISSFMKKHPEVEFEVKNGI